MERRQDTRISGAILVGAIRVRWDATPGEHTLMTRAMDVEGNTQPDRVPFNEKGYLFNQPLPHPVRVSG